MARNRPNDKRFARLLSIGGLLASRTPTPVDDIGVGIVWRGRVALRRVANWIRRRRDMTALLVACILIIGALASGCRSMLYIDNLIPDLPDCDDIYQEDTINATK